MTETQILFDLLEKGVSPAHVVSACQARLETEGFEKLSYGESWNLELGKKYYVQMPIIEEVNKVLFEDKSAKEAVYDLMLREKRAESNSLDWR